MAGLLGSKYWLLVGGEAVSDPDDSWMVKSEAGDRCSGDLGFGDSCREKNRESGLELRPGEASPGRPESSSGRLCGGSYTWVPVACSGLFADVPK